MIFKIDALILTKQERCSDHRPSGTANDFYSAKVMGTICKSELRGHHKLDLYLEGACRSGSNLLVIVTASHPPWEGFKV